MQKEIVISMPAYNEADGIRGFLDDLRTELCESIFCDDFHIIVVDDCSTDSTREEVQSAVGYRSGLISLVQNKQNLGHGPTAHRAYLSALAMSTRIVCFVDGDGQFTAQDVVICIAHAHKHEMVVLGVRDHRSDSLLRWLITQSLKFWFSLRYRTIALDVNSPLRVFPADILRRLLVLISPSSLIPNILLSAQVLGNKSTPVKYITVSHLTRRGLTKTGSTWQHQNKLLRLFPTKLVLFVLRASREFLFFRVIRTK